MARVRKRIETRKDGSKKTSWTIDYNDTFDKRKIKGGYKTKVEAEKALAKKLHEINNGIYIETKKTLTFGEIADKFMKYHAEIHCKPSTLCSYKAYLKNHVLPYFGKMRAIDITPNTINELIKIKQKSGLSNKTVNHCVILTGTIFEHAINERLLNINPVSRVKKLRVINVEMQFLIKEEIFAILDTAKKHYPDFYPLLFTAIFTGMRRGELLGLTWDKINWVIKQIKVDKSLYRDQFVTPKTINSFRKINMSNDLAKVLKEWRLKCPPGKLNLVFPNSEGDIQDADNMIKRRFLPVLRRSGVNKIRFHDLRHTFASLLLAENVPGKYIQMQLGHSSIQVTMDRYSHLMPEVHLQGVEALNNFFEKDKISTQNTLYNIL